MTSGIAVLVLALAVLGGARVAMAQSADVGPPPGRLVDVGGRRLHRHCSGSGSPTVVIEAGASAFAIDFSLVQPEILYGIPRSEQKARISARFM